MCISDISNGLFRKIHREGNVRSEKRAKEEKSLCMKLINLIHFFNSVSISNVRELNKITSHTKNFNNN